MSETPSSTVTPAGTVTVAKLTKAIKPFLSAIHTTAAKLAKVETEAGSLKVQLGGTINQAVVAMTAVGASIAEAQDRILSELTKGNGETYSWSTVAQWQRAAVVRESLPEAVRDSFNVYSLVDLGRVTDKDGERTALAEKLVKAGTLSIRQVRDAAAGEKTPNNGRSSAPSSSKIVGKLTKVASETREAFAAVMGEWTPEFQDAIEAVAILGVRIGKGGKVATKAESNAVGELLYMGPAPEDAVETQ